MVNAGEAGALPHRPGEKRAGRWEIEPGASYSEEKSQRLALLLRPPP